MGRKQYFVFAALLLAGVGMFGAIWLVRPSNPPDAALRIPGVEELIPARGDEVQQQNRVGIDLEPTFIVRSFSISPDARCLKPTELVEFVRPVDGVNLFVYQPDEGKPITQLWPDNNCVKVIIEDLQRPGETHEVQWVFTAS